MLIGQLGRPRHTDTASRLRNYMQKQFIAFAIFISLQAAAISLILQIAWKICHNSALCYIFVRKTQTKKILNVEFNNTEQS